MINKSKSSSKTVFVRNTEQALPSVKVSDAKLKSDKTQCDSTPIEPKRTEAVDEPLEFNVPKTHSSEQVVKKSKAIYNMKSRKVKSVSDVDKNQLLFGEKISKQVNFPYEQPIYKDLIPLCVKMQSQPMIASRDPLPLKDKEPVLSDCLTPREVSEYTYQPANQITNRGQITHYRGLKLHSTMQSWCNE